MPDAMADHVHESWWLLEATAPPRPVYYAGPIRGKNDTRGACTEDANKAVRFPTEEAAKLTIAHMVGADTSKPVWPLSLMNSGWKATEHIFDYTPRATPAGERPAQAEPAIVSIEKRVKGGSYDAMYQVRLAVGVQSFDVNYVGTWEEANFTANMLRKALALASPSARERPGAQAPSTAACDGGQCGAGGYCKECPLAAPSTGGAETAAEEIEVGRLVLPAIEDGEYGDPEIDAFMGRIDAVQRRVQASGRVDLPVFVRLPASSAPAQAVETAGVPEGWEIVMVPKLQPSDEPNWDECIRQAEVATGLRVERHTLSIVIREVRRWLAGRAALQSRAPAVETAGVRKQDALDAKLPSGWRFYTADASIVGRFSLMLTRDEAGTKAWHRLSEAEQEVTDLFVSGEGRDFPAAMNAARAALATVEAKEKT